MRRTVLRTTLMNLFMLEPALGEQDYIELFLAHLLPLRRAAKDQVAE